MTSVNWQASMPGSLRFERISRTTPTEALKSRLDELLAAGSGYVEIGRPGDAYPMLAVGFQDEVAVVQAFLDAETLALLDGGGGTAGFVEVPVIDDFAVFDRRAAVNPEAVWPLVARFAEGDDVMSLGKWTIL